MIAPIDGSDPPEPPPTPVTFDSRIRSIRAKSTRGGDARAMRHRIYNDVLIGAVVRCDSDGALAMNRGLGHQWNKVMAINGIGPGP